MITKSKQYQPKQLTIPHSLVSYVTLQCTTGFNRPSLQYQTTKQTIHRTTQQSRRVRSVPHLREFCPGICLTTEEKSTES